MEAGEYTSLACHPPRRSLMAEIDRRRLHEALHNEKERFARDHPRSRALFERAKGPLLTGVPMSWMTRWAGGFPIFATSGAGAYVEDVDGHR